MQLLAVPSPKTGPPFSNQQDFMYRLDRALGVHALPGRITFNGIAYDSVRSADGLRYEVCVNIDDPSTVGAPAPEGQKVTGTAAAVWVLERALAQIGFTTKTATIDAAGIMGLSAF
ncbi:hypothetical protein [Kribbella albertanoniae]|uniref:Uncharacterized protein n=1 Tax=Kribbella albertanoniae TaxID=1266829 RepID=A0A4R4PP15_9ACTN|nr:hypothetical protein [Kribbella albertanoniae]TDC23957.1 hypothetical protein E1261_27300 [Kribbella albertanoniae]